MCEVGLLPGPDALLAPEWVPWAARVRPEELAQEQEEAAAEAEAAASALVDATEGEEGRERLGDDAEADAPEA